MRNLFILLFFVASCFAYGQKSPEKFLPKELKKSISFNMTMKEFLSKKDPSTLSYTDDGFRHIYVETLNEGDITNIVYYFDKDDHEPLYEVILVYKDEATRDAASKKLLGNPNVKGSEWLKTHKKRKDVRAWTFKKKLIITQLLDKTEWADHNWDD